MMMRMNEAQKSYEEGCGGCGEARRDGTMHDDSREGKLRRQRSIFLMKAGM